MQTEYIRKQDAIAVAESYQVERTGFHLNDYEYGRNQVADSVASDLEDIEPADVAPAKYGEWVSVPEMWGAFDIRYYCSECGKDAIINNGERYVLSDYCPHCGAIMGNKRGNENGR